MLDTGKTAAECLSPCAAGGARRHNLSVHSWCAQLDNSNRVSTNPFFHEQFISFDYALLGQSTEFVLDYQVNSRVLMTLESLRGVASSLSRTINL
eukprot:4021487-Amphidinium_carterae.1